jgi:hypothetical protein
MLSMMEVFRFLPVPFPVLSTHMEMEPVISMYRYEV